MQAALEVVHVLCVLAARTSGSPVTGVVELVLWRLKVVSAW